MLCHGVDQLVREIPAPSKRRTELGVGESEQSVLSRGNRDVLLSSKLGSGGQIERTMLVKGEPSDVVQYTCGERFIYAIMTCLSQ